MFTVSEKFDGNTGFLVIAHRGASHLYPENTLSAFAGAARLGADWVELDARRCADGTVVVHHDPALPDGRVIAETTSAALPDDVATLADALSCCGDHGLGVNVEIKWEPTDTDTDADADTGLDPGHALVDSVLATMAEGPGPYLVTSFDPGCLDQVRRRDPSVATGQLGFAIAAMADFVVTAAEAGHAAVNPWAPLVDAAAVAAAHAAGLAIYPWTVDDPAQLQALIDLGVDGIITNEPDVLRALLPPLGGAAQGMTRSSTLGS